MACVAKAPYNTKVARLGPCLQSVNLSLVGVVTRQHFVLRYFKTSSDVPGGL